MAYLGSSSGYFDTTRTAAPQRDAERFNGDGVTTTFTLSRVVSSPTDINVVVGNILQEPTISYSVNGTTLTFTEAPPTGAYNVYVIYRNSGNNHQVTLADGSVSYNKLADNLRLFTTDNLTPNGNNSVFTLSEPPADANTVFVTVDGVMQRAPVHYTTSGSTITFASAPPYGSNVHVRHLGFRTSTTLTAIPVGTYIPQPNIATPTITTPTIVSPTITGTPYFTSNVGIGTNTPSAPLEISSSVSSVGSGGDSATLRLKSTGTNSNPGILFKSTDTVDQNFNSCIIRSGVPASNSNTGSFIVEVQSSGTLTEVFRINGDKILKFDSGYGSVAAAYGCRAWVNFNGQGTPSITGSGNVTSLTDNATGYYTVNFTNAMPDTAYAATGSCKDYDNSRSVIFNEDYSRSRTSSTFPCQIMTSSNAAYDTTIISVAFFR